MNTSIHIPDDLKQIWKNLENKSEIIRDAIERHAGIKQVKIWLPTTVYDDLALLAEKEKLQKIISLTFLSPLATAFMVLNISQP